MHPPPYLNLSPHLYGDIIVVATVAADEQRAVGEISAGLWERIEGSLWMEPDTETCIQTTIRQ